MGKHVRSPIRVRRLRLATTATVATAGALVVALVVLAWFAIPSSQVATDSAAVSARSATPPTSGSSGSSAPSASESGTPTSATTSSVARPRLKPDPSARRRTPADPRAALARVVQRKVLRPQQPAVSGFRIASLNILGSNHKGRGNARASGEASLLQERGVAIVGLQEVQRDQRQVFLNKMPGYTMWPQDALGRQGYRLQIMFRNDRFEMVDSGGINTPFVGMSVPMPYVLLRDRASGAEFWVIDAHTSPQGRQGERNIATNQQAALVDQLNDSHPVLMVGDMNEHTSWFCRLASQVPAWSANGASYSDGCHGPFGPVRIDWIVGSSTTTGDDGVTFSGYQQDGTTKGRHLSDHFLVYADAKVTSAPDDGE